MTMKQTIAAIALVMASVAGVVTLRAQSGYDLFQKALAAERADGNLQQAIQLYARVVKEFGGDRALAARALVRMAECHEKLGQAEAQTIYERVLREYADQPEAANLARARLRVDPRPARAAQGERLVWGPGREVDLFGTVSPDGRYLTYVDWFGVVNVVLRDLQTGTDRPLTPNTFFGQYGYPSWSAISRTGDRVAYSWAPPDAGDELRVASLTGQGVPPFRRLLPSSGRDSLRPFDWSPDGNWIALLIEREDRSSQIGLVNLRSGDLRILKSIDWRGVGKIVFSPDGRFIAYDLLEGEGIRTQRVLVMAVDAGREVAVTTDRSKNHVMGWAADGHLLFASDRSGSLGLWAVRVEDGRPRSVPVLVKSDLSSTWSLGLTRNGALYVWKRAGAEYVSTASIDLATGALRQAAGSIQHFVDSRGRPAWSADGKDLLYVSCGPDGGGACRIFIRAAQTGVSREVPHALGYVGFPRLGPDGVAILTDGRDLKGRRGIYLIDSKTGSTTPIAEQPPDRRRWPEWWPGTRSIYYQNQGRGEPLVVLRREIDSDAETEIFRTSACNVGPARISPDGRSIACIGNDIDSRTATLMVFALSGGASRAVMRVSSSESLFPWPWQWTPDSRAILVRKMAPLAVDELWLAPMAGEPRRLNIDIRNWSGPFDLSPDGRQIAFVASAGAQGAEVWALENFLPPGGNASP
ncbi:MAG: tetratricopeptide repeat protein [Acidobacteria bacterium]|nr:tetratricopeptide repeat protein [Acidobacteriota bacterium]